MPVSWILVGQAPVTFLAASNHPYMFFMFYVSYLMVYALCLVFCVTYLIIAYYVLCCMFYALRFIRYASCFVLCISHVILTYYVLCFAFYVVRFTLMFYTICLVFRVSHLILMHFILC